VPDVEEAVPLGAAILAGIGTGVYRDEQDAFQQVYRTGTTYVPIQMPIRSTKSCTASISRSIRAIKSFVQKGDLIARTNE